MLNSNLVDENKKYKNKIEKNIEFENRLNQNVWVSFVF